MHRRSMTRHLPVLAAASAVGLFVASPALAGVDRVSVQGQLIRFAPVVPEHAQAQVEAVYDTEGDSTITLTVTGLRPNTEYGAHAHVEACGDSADDAGPDFQLHPNTDLDLTHNPTYENPVNEIWLDVETDETGRGSATTTMPWQFSPERRAGSVMIHAEPTNPGPRFAGVAGPRIACLTVDF